MTQPSVELPVGKMELVISPFRRYFALGCVFMLGVFLLYMGATTPANFFLRALVVVLGIGALMVGRLFYLATDLSIIFDEKGLSLSDGRVIAPIDDIDVVEKGMLALKPTNGFSVVMKSVGNFYWIPGVVWRFRYRVGIGGVTSPGPAKAMADMLTAYLADLRPDTEN